MSDETGIFVDELKPGTQLMHGQYTIENFLNAGGFGITYMAKDSLDRKIVIKECFPGAFCRRSRYIVQARSRAHQSELQSIVRLFVQEARSLAKLRHPNIVGVHQVFEENDTAYMALDFVEGRDLLDILEDKDRTLEPAQIEKILRDLLGAVAFIHDQSMLHRDISPDNILINGDMTPVLIDFGAAREQATKQSRVLSALRVVKDGYSPQEFYIAGSEQFPSSDLYALGATFYHLISGEAPPNSQSRLASIASGSNDAYVPLHGRVEGYDGNFLAAIDKALSVLPKDRVQTAHDWIDIIEGKTPRSAAAASVKTAEPRYARPRTETPEAPQKSKTGLLMASVAVAAILAIGIGVTQSGLLSDSESSAELAASTPPAPAVSVPAVSAPAPVKPAPVDLAGIAKAVQMGLPAAAEATADLASDAEKLDANLVASVPLTSTQPAAAEAQTAEAEPETTQTLQAEATEIPAEALDAPDVMATAPLDLSPMPESAPVDTILAHSEPSRDATLEMIPLGQAPVADSLPVAVDVTTAEPVMEPQQDWNEASFVMSAWSAALPFESDLDRPNVIAQVDETAPDWIKPDMQILAVNGTPIKDGREITSVLRKTMQPGAASEVTVQFTVRQAGEDEDLVQTAILPVLQQTALLNGIGFETRKEGETWKTRVTTVPEAYAADLHAGDEIIAYLPTNELISDRTTLQTILNRELSSGKEQLLFAVAREGSMWATTLNFAGVSN